MTTPLDAPAQDQMIADIAPSVASNRRRAGLLAAFGMLLLQIGWIFAVPPFRGSDEFDHVFKAEAVAHGDWFASPTDATRGTGAFVDVPADVVAAARAQCQGLKYTTDADCVGTAHGQSQRVASGAGRYHPLFYAVVGIPALPFHGHAVVYVMRVMTALFSWLLIWGAISATRVWARTEWPSTALAISATPVLVYSASVVAPNGVEMAAALAFWASAMAIVRGLPSRATLPILLLTAISGSLLVTLRSLGPLWCLLIGVTVVGSAWPGWGRVRTLLSDRRVLAVTVTIVVATLLSCAYILSMSSFELADNPVHYSLAHRVSALSNDVVYWMLQTIAAFPLRNEPTKTVVYACYLVLMVALFALGVRAGRRRLKWALAGTFLLGSLVPFVICVATFNSYGEAWQGRYALPYTVGIAVLAGLALDAGGGRVGPRLRLAGLLLFVTAQVVGPMDVMHRSLAHPSADASSWVHPSQLVVALLLTFAAGLFWWASTSPHPGTRT